MTSRMVFSSLVVPILFVAIFVSGCKKNETADSPAEEAPGVARTPPIPPPSKEMLERIGPESDLDVRWLLSDPLLVVAGRPKGFITSSFGKGNEQYLSEIIAGIFQMAFNYGKIERFVVSLSPGVAPVEFEENGRKVVRPSLVFRRCATIRFDMPIDRNELLAPFLNPPEMTLESMKRQVGDLEYFELSATGGNTPQRSAIHFAGDDTLVLVEGFEVDLRDVFDGKAPQNAAVDRIKRLPFDSCDLVLAASREGLDIDPGLLTELLAGLGQPREFASVLAGNFRALTASVKLDAAPDTPMLNVRYEAIDPDGAEKVREYVEGMLVVGQTSLAAMDDAAKEAMRLSADFASAALNAMNVQSEGSRVEFTIDKFKDFDKVFSEGIRNQKEAVRQMQIMQGRNEQLLYLAQAFFAYYQTHKKFPSAIRAEDGTPLLGWRVAILSTIGMKELYEQFKRDEPWDGETNKPLLEKMPSAFRPLGVEAPPNTTLVRMFDSPGTPFSKPDLKPEDLAHPRSTLLFLSVPPSKAIEWTRPEELVFEVDKIEEVAGNNLFGISCAGEVISMPVIPLSDPRSEQQRRFLDAVVKGLPLPAPPQNVPRGNAETTETTTPSSK